MASYSAAPPINVRSVINLPSLGVKADDISFKTLSLASDKAVCLRETSDPKQVSILDLSSGQFVHRVQAGTDGAALTPNTRILAVRGRYFVLNVACILTLPNVIMYACVLQWEELCNCKIWNLIRS
jgi:hypothetical protein